MPEVELKTETSCEIDDLIRAVMKKTDKPHNEVESAFFKEYLYPEGTKTYVNYKFHQDNDEQSWLKQAIYSIMVDNGIMAMYITEAI